MKWPVKEVSMLYCEKCGANYNQEYHHRCDEWDIACMGKQVCIDCRLHHSSPLKEVRAIPEGGYCKHLTPEYWENKGYERGWGDAAVCNFPELEILLKENDAGSSFIILNGTLRRPVRIEVNRKTGGVDASY
jgi:hypothetical protein